MTEFAFNFSNYFPCLRWKQGEYQALGQLSLRARGQMMPLLEVSEMDFDFEGWAPPKSIDQHLKEFAKRVSVNWGRRSALVDLKQLPTLVKMANGAHPLSFIFDDLRTYGIPAVPVTCLGRHPDYQTAVRRAVSVDRAGVCFRLNLDQIGNKDFLQELQRLMRYFAVSHSETDIIVDLEAPTFEPMEGFVKMVKSYLERIPRLKTWRSLAVIGTSFPKTMGGILPGLVSLERKEWLSYKNLRISLGDLERVPNFGDYVIANPAIIRKDYRVLKPSANIRYAIDDAWLVMKGKVLKDHGYEQFRALSKKLMENPAFSGRGFSAGDAFIEDCATGNGKIGSLTTWRQVGTNRHLEKIITDLSKLPAS